MEACSKCGWGEEKQARLQELEDATKAINTPGRIGRMKAEDREEKTGLEAIQKQHREVCLAPENQGISALPEVAWQAALADAPTQALIDELQRRALENGGVLPAIPPDDVKPARRKRKSQVEKDAEEALAREDREREVTIQRQAEKEHERVEQRREEAEKAAADEDAKGKPILTRERVGMADQLERTGLDEVRTRDDDELPAVRPNNEEEHKRGQTGTTI